MDDLETVFGAFFKDGEDVEEIGELDDEEVQEDTDATDRGYCAYIFHHGRCNAFGSGAYVRNKLKDQSVRVTIRAKWTQTAGGSGTREYTRKLSAGMAKYLGCTRSHTSSIYSTYTVIGCEPL